MLLPLPSIEVLAGAAGGVGRSTLVHIMETCVVSWMKQVKVRDYIMLKLISVLSKIKRCMELPLFFVLIAGSLALRSKFKHI